MSSADSTTHELADFMRAMTNEMAFEYERIQKRAKEDPGTAGDQGEENWATLLRGWLPPTYHVVTKGRILGLSGVASPQVDVLVLHPTYPKHLMDKKLYLAGGVAAAFECKVTLKAAHVKDAVSNGVAIKQNMPDRFGTPYKELHSPIVYGLLAHSHSWNHQNSQPEQIISAAHDEASGKLVTHPREELDVLCVADLATWSCFKLPWYLRAGQNPTDWCCMTAFVRQSKFENSKESFTPIGSLIGHLLLRLAWEDTSVRGIAEYFARVGLSGNGSGSPSRHWKTTIYSDAVRAKVATEGLASGWQWTEWRNLFP